MPRTAEADTEAGTEAGTEVGTEAGTEAGTGAGALALTGGVTIPIMGILTPIVGILTPPMIRPTVTPMILMVIDGGPGCVSISGAVV